jgi:hypothetical protein
MRLDRARLNATGIGFAGIEGVWWRPAAEAFALPGSVAAELRAIGGALFRWFDVVIDLYRAGGAVRALLDHNVPPHLPRLMSPGRVESLRPDFQLRPMPGGFQPVVTELEICPSAHGFAHAMQAGYHLPPDLAASFARYLGGREFLFVGTQHWSEFLIEQLAFCRALRAAGARARVLYDQPLAVMAEEFRRGARWQPPMFGIPEKPAHWNDDLLGRLRAHGLLEFMGPDDSAWPEAVGEAVVFRFGYFDCFAPEHLQYFLRWQAGGATLLNPAMFILDSKVILATLALPEVREALGWRALVILERCIPETKLLCAETLAQLRAEKDEWIIKFAGFDGGNRAWGGRSLQIGAAHSAESWARALQDALALPWPVVAQRLVPSARVSIDYVDAHDHVQRMENGVTRLRTFFLREGDAAAACGAHLTVSASSQVSEAVESVQAPVMFTG